MFKIIWRYKYFEYYCIYIAKQVENNLVIITYVLTRRPLTKKLLMLYIFNKYGKVDPQICFHLYIN